MPQHPTILVFPFELMSHYLRCITLAKTLTEDFTCMFAHSSKYRQPLIENGFQTFTCEGPDAAKVVAMGRQFDFSWLNEKDLERYFLQQVKAIEKYQPDFVLGDNSLTLRMAADKTGIPMITLLNGYMTKFYAPGRKISRLHPQAKNAAMLPNAIYKMMVRTAEYAHMRSIHKPYRNLRKKYDLPETDYYLDEFESDINLICDLPDLFPQQKLPDSYQFIGPLLYQSSGDETPLLQQLDPTKKTIYVSMGSSGNYETIKALNNKKFAQYNIVVSGDADKKLHAPHMIHQPFINFDAIANHVDIVLCHAGNGTVYQALQYGIPVLSSTWLFEQEWNEQRVVELGLGASVTEADSSKIEEAITYWMLQKNKGALRKISKQIQQFNTANAIRDALHVVSQ